MIVTFFKNIINLKQVPDNLLFNRESLTKSENSKFLRKQIFKNEFWNSDSDKGGFILPKENKETSFQPEPIPEPEPEPVPSPEPIPDPEPETEHDKKPKKTK